MISVSTAFAAANAILAKKPIHIIEIEGYSRAFTDRSVADGGLFLSQSGGSSPTAGNVLLAFMVNGDGGSTPGISDNNGNSWTHILNNLACASGLMNAWWAIANAGTAPEQVTFTTAGNRSNSAFFVVEIPAAYASFVFGHNSGSGSPATVTTSDGDTLSVPNGPNVSSGWTMFSISFGAASGLAIGLVNFGLAGQGPTNPAQIVIEQTPGGGPCYVVLGTSLPLDIIVQAGAFGNIGGFTSFPGTVTLQSATFDWLVNIDPLKLTVSDLDGGADLSDLVFNVEDWQQQLTADLATFIFEGKTCTLLTGFVGMDIGDYATLFTGVIDTVDSDAGNLEYKFTASDVNVKKLTRKIYVTGDDGFATDSKHPKTLNGHPLDILVSALTQAGVSAIDTTKIAYYRDTIFSGLTYVFTLTAAPTAKDFIENELMKPLGMYLWPNNLGILSINSFYPAMSGNGSYTPPTPPVMELVVSNNAADANVIDVPLATEAPLINQVIFDFDDDGTGSSKFNAEQIVDYDESITKYGLVGGQTIQSQGMRSAFQGYFMADLVGFLICLRYGLKNLTLDPLSLIWTACQLEPGDIVSMTNAFVPDRSAGVLGVTGQTFEVLDRNWDFMKGVVELKLLAIDLSKFKQFLITTNGEADFAAASSADKAKYIFLCGTDDLYSTGVGANTLG